MHIMPPAGTGSLLCKIMYIKEITLKDFRNYRTFIHPFIKVNIFTGKKYWGKPTSAGRDLLNIF